MPISVGVSSSIMRSDFTALSPKSNLLSDLMQVMIAFSGGVKMRISAFVPMTDFGATMSTKNPKCVLVFCLCVAVTFEQSIISAVRDFQTSRLVHFALVKYIPDDCGDISSSLKVSLWMSA